MTTSEWDQHYLAGDPPWDSGAPDPQLVAFGEFGSRVPTRVLEVGCGTGANALWLAERGFSVTALDISPLAIARATARCATAHKDLTLLVRDFLEEGAPGGPYDFVFDRGVFHVFDGAHDRARFAAHVAAALDVGGRWLSLVGSTEGPPRGHGPPRRSASDIVAAIEPSLELEWLRSSRFTDDGAEGVASWAVLARRRGMPAQPSSHH